MKQLTKMIGSLTAKFAVKAVVSCGVSFVVAQDQGGSSWLCR